jgi:hypothetical protein
VTCGNFDRALKAFFQNSSDLDPFTVFQEGIWVPALSHHNLRRMHHRLRFCQDEGYVSVFRQHCGTLLAKAQRHRMFHLLYETQVLLERTDEATETAVHLFKHCDQTNAGLKHVRSALESATDALKVPPEQWTGTVPRDKIEKYVRLLPLQRRFLDFCIARKLTKVASLNLFSGARMAETMVILLLKNLECGLAADILAECKGSELNLSFITRSVADILSNEADAILAQFVTALEANCSDHIFRSVAHAVFLRLNNLRDAEGLTSIVQLLQTCVVNPEFRCMLLMEFNQLGEAFALARRENLWPVIPMIGHIGSQTGNTGLSNDAQKELMTFERRSGHS